MTPRAHKLLLPDGACDRILAAVGFVPDDLDRDQLLSDLEGIRSLYRTNVEVRAAPADREAHIREIVKVARQLQSLIDYDWHRLRQHRAALDRLISDVKSEFPGGLLKVLGVGHGVSPFENLVGLMLRETFELHFKARAGYTNRTVLVDGADDVVESVETCGPFIDFAQAALTELGITNSGIPYSRRSIAAALTKVLKQ